MQALILTEKWTDLRSEYVSEKTVVIYNTSPHPLYVYYGDILPSSYKDGIKVLPSKSFISYKKDVKTWIYGKGRVTISDLREVETSDYQIVDFPDDVWTSKEEITRRLRVDVAQTGLFEGREFRTNRRYTLASGATRVIKFSCPVSFIIRKQHLSVAAGSILFRAYREGDGVEGGTWTPVRNILPNCDLTETPDYTMKAMITTGGTFVATDPDNYKEVFELRSSGATAQTSTVSEDVADERGLPAGTYYLTFTENSNSTASFVYTLIHEERLS